VAGSALVLAGALWLLWPAGTPTGSNERPIAPVPTAGDPADGAGPAATVPTPAAAAPGKPPRVDSRAALATILESRQLDPDRAINGWQTWRAARGFFDPNELAGTGPENATAELYAGMDDLTLEQRAAAGELGALQEQAARLESVDSIGALGKYMAAAQQGSAAAMFGASRALLGVAAMQAEDNSGDPELAETLRDWRNMDGSTDIRQEALAWALAAVRTDGAAVLEGSRLRQIEALAAELDEEQLRMACAESLAYFGGYRGLAGNSGIGRGRPPPVFITAPGVYGRLPCRDTAAPITPPPRMQRCESMPAADGRGQRVEVWVCPEN
jgi:hypothetical protein